MARPCRHDLSFVFHLIEIIGHRGIPLLEPENTMLGFRSALKHGAQQLELDVRLTKDRVPVVLHDVTVRRTTNGRGRISKLILEQVRDLDAGKGESVPMLEEVLDEFGGKIYLHIDIKGRVSSTKIVRMIVKKKLERNVCISSFSHKTLRFIKRLSPHIATAALVRKKRRRIVPYLHSLGVDALHVPYRVCTKSLVNALHGAGLKVRVWGVPDNVSAMKKLIDWKVDGMIVDRADTLRDLLRGDK